MAQSIIRRNSIVLIRYPFTDLQAVKVRPAVILTPNHLLSQIDDVLCLFISSILPDKLLITDFILESEDPCFVQTGLKRTSVFRAHKLALLHKSLVIRNLGRVENNIMDEINQRLRIALGLKD